MNKATLHLSTGQYEFIEVEVTGEPADIIRKWFVFKEQYESRLEEINRAKTKDAEENPPF